MSDGIDNSSSYERIIIIIYIILSFIFNLIIIISIFIFKNKNISLILRVTLSILIVNFINIFSYSFQWVNYRDKIEYNNNRYYIIKLLSGNSNNLDTCKLQSFLILFSSVSQDYLIILFVYIVNKRTVIKSMLTNILIIVSIFIPLFIALLFAALDGLGVNDDFCYIKKYAKTNVIINNTGYNDNEIYKSYKYFHIISIILYTLRIINFTITVLFLIKIIKYITKEKANIYLLNKLHIFFIQLFKLFIIFSYRLFNLIFENYPDDLRKIYNLLSSIDGVLIPLAYLYSNGIFQNIYYLITKRKMPENKKENDEEEKIPSKGNSQNNIEDDKDLNSNSNSQGLLCPSDNENNFDLTY